MKLLSSSRVRICSTILTIKWFSLKGLIPLDPAMDQRVGSMIDNGCCPAGAAGQPSVFQVGKNEAKIGIWMARFNLWRLLYILRLSAEVR